ncbi:MAG: aldehyde dehydrogenase family protein [Desulfuromonadales bacterium]|nr:aldehyde dehydrogenase family protein [Desulfuromonadales bacterium]
MTSKPDRNKTGQIDVVSPFDRRLLATLPLQTADDAERMLATATRLTEDRDGWLEVDERIAILQRLAELVAGEADDFARLIAAEGGKPLRDARVEVGRAIDGIGLAVRELLRVMRGEEIPMGHTAATRGRTAFTVCEPIGLVLAISAFNHPLNLIVHQVIPAVAVGCPVIVKPALTTPLNCLRLCELLQQAGLPEGWCQPIVCDNAVSEQLATDPRLAFLTFIGSAKVGWSLRAKLAPGVRCALEHGGAAPVIIDATADLKQVIPALLKGGFYHAGQVCVSVQRVFAPADLARELAEQLAAGAAQLVVGDPRDEATEVGPLILPREVIRVHEWVEAAVAGGALRLTGSEALGETLYPPTVLYDPPADALVSTAEIFGPVVCVYPCQDRCEAIRRANSLDVAFQAAVFSNDLEAAFDTARRLDAAAVMINDHTAFRTDWMPFAGRRASGYGVGGIGYTMRDMLQEKLIVLKSVPTDPCHSPCG